MRTEAISLAARGLRPVADLAAERPHGDRLRYMAGCRCADCRRANSRYESERQKARRNGDWNGIVPAERAREHIINLGRRGLGRKAIAAAADVREQLIQAIRQGKKNRLRARSERRILAVTPAMISDRALVPANRLWKRIAQLLDEGYTRSFLAQQLGYKNRALQFNKEKVTARNEADIERLYRRLTT